MKSRVSEVGLKSALELVAKWFCGKRQLRIDWHRGDAVLADVQNCKISIPIAACSGDFDAEALLMLRSNVYHESAHILLSSAPTLKGTKFTIANGIEDVWIEAETSKKGDGIRGDFHESNSILAKKHAEVFANRNQNPDQTPPTWKEALYALMFSQQLIPIWNLSGEAKKLYDLAKPVFSQVVNAKSSKDCDKLAVKIYELWKDFIKEQNKKQKQQQQQQQQGEHGKSSPQDGSDDDSKPQDKPQNQPQDKSKDKSDGKSGSKSEPKESDKKDKPEKDNGKNDGSDKGSSPDKKDDGKEKPDSKGNKPKKSDSGSDKTDEDDKAGTGSSEDEGDDNQAEKDAIAKLEDDSGDSDIAKKIIAKEVKRVMENPDFYTSCRDFDQHIVYDVESWMKNKYNEIRLSIGASISHMVHMAEEAFLDMKSCETLHGIEDGDVDYSFLPQICKGLSSSVYCKTVDGEELNTAVVIVLDQSSSMSHLTKEVKKVLISIGELLTKLEIPFEVFGTTTFDHPAENKAFTRYRGMKFMHYKFFNESWNFIKARIISVAGHDNNLDGEALDYAEALLKTRTETRKVILSICDGQPCSGQSNNDIFGNHLQKTAERIRKEGMEVYAIGINTQAPAIYYGDKNFIAVPCVTEQEMFSKEVISALVNTVMKGRFQK